MHRTLSKFLIILTVGFYVSTAYGAKLYKWTDDAGNVHYTQTPPSEHDTIVEESDAPHAEANTPIPEDEILKATDIDAMQQRVSRCTKLEQELTAYRDHSQITDSDGNTVVVSDEMREAKIMEISAELKQNCR